MNILDLLKGQLSPEVLDQIGKQLGATNPDQVNTATNGLISSLLAALSKNTSKSEGLAALVSALDRDHDGSIINDIMGYISGVAATMQQRQIPTPEPSATNTSVPTPTVPDASTDGRGILGHVLGGLQPNVIAMIARLSGLDQAKISQLAAMVAPLVMGVLGHQRQQGQPVSGIGNLIKSVTQGANAQPVMGLLTKFLDRNGDGSVIDDIARLGMGAFNK